MARYLLFAVLCGCATTSTPATSTCVLMAPSLVPTAAAPGDVVVLSTARLTTANDTLVHVGAAGAVVQSVDRTDCDACDSCLAASECGACDDCDACATDCAPCVESVSFVVPELAPGRYPAVLRNVHGQAPAALLDVTSPSGDTGGDPGQVVP